MYQYTAPLFIRTITPMHAGTGDSVGHVDLPIQRESHTGFPKIEGSGIKGALRESAEANLLREKKNGALLEGFKEVHRLFGYDRFNLPSSIKKEMKDHFQKVGDFAAPIGFGNARLLLFPVKSAKGVFAYITCRQVLEQLKSDLETYNKTRNEDFDISALKTIPKTGCSSDELFIRETPPMGTVILDEYSFQLQNSKTCKQIADFLSERLYGKNNKSYSVKKMQSSLVILDNDDFADYVQYFTEVITRIKIDSETGTVAKGQLFTEEFLPAESVLYSMVQAAPELNKEGKPMDAKEVMVKLEKHLPTTAQIGADATIGKGLVNLSYDLLKTIKPSNNGTKT